LLATINFTCRCTSRFGKVIQDILNSKPEHTIWNQLSVISRAFFVD
jgi:hypothetical protein